MNIVEKWVKINKKKGISQTEAAKTLTMVCNETIESKYVSPIKKGKRRLIPCHGWMMLNDTLQSTFEDFGITFTRSLSSNEWVKLVDQLSAPRRIK